MKKWLYGVALGALLIAGNAAGITVHEVLSNGFWSANTERRLTLEELKEVGDYRELRPKIKRKQINIVTEVTNIKQITKGETESSARWKNTNQNTFTFHPNYFILDDNNKLITRHKESKEKTITKLYSYCERVYNSFTSNVYEIVQTMYSNKPTKKDARPTGPYVADDNWFPHDLTEKYEGLSASFYGTEHNAVTNIISDNEAYITGTLRQTGHIDDYLGYKVDEDASLLRTYTQHITTDADHVYIEQEMTENTQNDPDYNSQHTYQTQYTATFKKGHWEGEKEAISKVSNHDIAPWCKNYWRQNERY
ncbi:hypothetical protein IKW72_00705 [bacterium]|nr:hypothetical protein [bacterium]